MTSETPERAGTEAAAEPVDPSALTLAYLRILRRGQRRAQARGTAYVVYCVLLLATIWLGPYLAAAVVAAGDGSWQGPLADRLLTALPGVLAAGAAVVAVYAARTACWRGPVLPEAAAVGWLVPHPVRRRALLTPPLRRYAVAALAIGSGGGAALGLALHGLHAGTWWSAVLGGAWYGAVPAVGCTAIGVLVQRHQPALTGDGTGGGARTRAPARALPVAGAAAAVLAGLAALAAVRGSTGLGQALLWSGPWGWAGLPLAAAVGQAPGWAGPVGAVLGAAAVGAAVCAAYRAVGRVPARVLRLQAALSPRVTAALYAADLRGVSELTGSVYRRGHRRRGTLPVPRRRWLLVPWRDLTALLRAPGRAVSAALWTAAAVAGYVVLDEGAVAALWVLVAGCRAAERAAAGARGDAADPRRAAALPWRRGDLALRHAVLPTALLTVAGGAALLGYAALGGAVDPGTVPLLAAAVPVCVAAALCTAYRGEMSPELLIGTETGLGNTGVLQALLWHVRGALLPLGAAAPALALPLGPAGAGWLLLVAVAAGTWLHRLAHRHGAPLPRTDPADGTP